MHIGKHLTENGVLQKDWYWGGQFLPSIFQQPFVLFVPFGYGDTDRVSLLLGYYPLGVGQHGHGIGWVVVLWVLGTHFYILEGGP